LPYANLFDVEKSGMDAEHGLDFREQKRFKLAG
jgi:hypothetical protein